MLTAMFAEWVSLSKNASNFPKTDQTQGPDPPLFAKEHFLQVTETAASQNRLDSILSEIG